VPPISAPCFSSPHEADLFGDCLPTLTSPLFISRVEGEAYG
jgi:hypothetical protein